MLKVLDLNGVEKIVVVEAMGIPIGSVLSTMTDIPMSIMRKRPYGLPKEIAVHQATGYSKGELYLNGINKGDRVVIIDDVVSTGGTMRALLQALEIAGADVADVCIAIQRGDPDIGRPYKSLVKITVDEKVHVVEQHL
jgi:adenine phosphoribosyltransferase